MVSDPGSDRDYIFLLEYSIYFVKLSKTSVGYLPLISLNNSKLTPI